jgi:Uma2 family endonuclease
VTHKPMTPTALEIDKFLPATLTAPGMSEAEFIEWCSKFPEAMVEYTKDGTLIVMPPNDPKSATRGSQIVRQLGIGLTSAAREFAAVRIPVSGFAMGRS